MAAPLDFAIGFEALRDYVRQKPPREQCDLCGSPVPEMHLHLLDPAAHTLLCACQACGILFSSPGSKFKRVPRRIRRVENLLLSDSAWEDLAIPINMVYFFVDTATKRAKAMYPSPAGATESQLRLEAWDEIVFQNPILKTLEPDVEALLVNRLKDPEYFLLPIDECYKLVGLIRARWRGLSGGAEARLAILDFFADIRSRAQVVTREAHA